MNTPYLLIPIAIISLSFYLLGQFLVKLSILSENLHRKIWNSILLFVFLSTVILGLLLAVQVNYKLEWTFVKALLKWHVDFGIGLSFVALFHLIRNLPYYSNIMKSSSDKFEVINVEKQLSNRKLKVLIFLSGFVAMVIQVLLIRELTTVFEGNELMMSWMLGIWMLLTGIGVIMGRQKQIKLKAEKALSTALYLLALIPVVIVVFINLLKNQIFPIGLMVSPIHFLILLLVVLSPICFIVGIIYSLFINLLRSNQNDFIKVYAFESLGSLIGGLVVSFLFIQWLSVLQSLLILSAITLGFLFFAFRRNNNLFSGFLISTILILFFVYPIDNWIKSFLFTNQNVIESKETYYGNLTITESANQYNFFGNGSLLFSTDNTILNEENVHYAMLQKKNPEHILIVSGGISGMIEEILKYPSVKSIDYVELNPSLVKIADKYRPLPIDGKVHFSSGDGRRFIQQTVKKFDVVIFAIPSPSSIQINRFYTDEFIQRLKQKLTPNAVIIYGLLPAGNYVSPIKAGIEASIYQTLVKSFSNVKIIPGEKDYLLASDSCINIRISEMAAGSRISNKFVNPYYLDDYSIKQRGDMIKKSIAGMKLINTDSRPIPVFYETMQFISQFKNNIWLIIAIPIIVLMIPLIFLKSIPKGMYIAGFSGSAIEILLFFSFQIIYGYVYSAIGLIIAVFMGGLAFGSLLGYRFRITPTHFIFSQFALSAYALIFPLLWYFQSEISHGTPILIVFFAMTFLPSVIVGFQYVAGTTIMQQDMKGAATSLYSADLIGSALGVVVTTVLLLPLLGLMWCCFVIAGFNFVGAVLTLSTHGKIFRK